MTKSLSVLILLASLLLHTCSGQLPWRRSWRRHICPDREDIIMRVEACVKTLDDKSNLDVLDYCYVLKGSRECLATVFAGCSAYDLLTRELPDDIRYAELGVNKEMSKCPLF